MDNSPELLKIGDFARLAQTNLRTLRYYEELGLLEPAQRSDGGFRYYRPTDVNRVRVIHGLQELGLQLEEIRALVDTRALQGDRKQWLAGVETALRRHEELIEQRVKELRTQKKKIGDALAKLNDCAPCPHHPGVNNNFCEPCQHTGVSLPEFLSALY